MSGPKHLWSGDWEQESTRADEWASPRSPAPDEQTETQPEPEHEPEHARLWTRQQLAIATGAALATAAITIGLVSAFDGSSKPKGHGQAVRPAAQVQPTTPQTTTPGLGTVPQTTPSTSPQTTPPTTPQTTPQSTTIPMVTGPTADWLGMQIVTSPAGVVISTVRLGSPADAAGLEPGDEIMQIDGHQITKVDQLRTVTADVKLGSLVGIEVLRSSSVLVKGASVEMTEHPTIHP